MIRRDSEELQKKFGENAQRIRLSKSISLRGVASNCELDDSNISKIEHGKFNIQLSTIFELAKGLEVPPQALLDF